MVTGDRSVNALVTGGAGFIGRHVVSRLLNDGATVRVVDDLSRASADGLQEFSGCTGYLGLIQGDVADGTTLEDSLGGMDTIFHLAASVAVGTSVSVPADGARTNVLGTLNVLEAARGADLRIVLVSTCHVYGSAEKPLDEKAPTRPVSPYAASKLAADDLAIGYEHAFQLRQTIVRPFNVYGPWQRDDLEGGVVARFIRSAVMRQPIELHGTGLQTRDFIFVEDAAHGIVAAAADSAIAQTINLATGVETSIKDLARIIDGGTGNIRHVAHPHGRSEVERYVGDASVAAELLDWSARTPLSDGIARTRQWFEERMVL